jgi:hypothetical protein
MASKNAVMRVGKIKERILLVRVFVVRAFVNVETFDH